MLNLNNGCRAGAFQVYPADWNTPNADMGVSWYIKYRFYDPRYPKPKQVVTKLMNAYKTLPDRQRATRDLMKIIKDALILEDYNPFTKTVTNSNDIPFIVALRKVAGTLKLSDYSMKDIRYVIDGVEEAANKILIDGEPLAKLVIHKVSRKHIREVFAWREEHREWSNNRQNKYRSWLMVLFNGLVEMELVEHNPIIGIKKLSTVKTLRAILSMEELELVSNHLQSVDYNFYRFTVLFANSGMRISEMLRLKMGDLDLRRGRLKMTIQKGKQYKTVWRPIKESVLPLWSELVGEEDMYVFHRGFTPGYAERPLQYVTPVKWWRQYVKIGLGIDKDLYSLKHLHTDLMAAELGLAAAMKFNLHTNMATTRVYAVGQGDRENSQFIKLKNIFNVTKLQGD